MTTWAHNWFPCSYDMNLEQPGGRGHRSTPLLNPVKGVDRAVEPVRVSPLGGLRWVAIPPKLELSPNICVEVWFDV